MRHWLSGQSKMPQEFKNMGLQYYIEEEQDKEIAQNYIKKYVDIWNKS